MTGRRLGKFRPMAKDNATVLSGGIALQASGLPEIATGEVPEWIHILPAGKLLTVDGRGPYISQNPDQIIAASMAESGGKIVVDENHATDIAGKAGLPARAAGWVVEMQSREDGIWAKVDWTKEGQALLSEKSYRGISPVIIHDAANKVARILRVSLTNKPNLRGMVALHSQTETETIMDMSALIKLLGLPEGATEEDVTAAIKKLADAKEPDGDDAAMQSALSDIAKKLGPDVKAEQTAICAALDTVLDPKATVPMAAFTALQAEFSEMQSGLGRKDAVAAVDAAIKAGKPGVKPIRDQYIAMHMQDPEGTQKVLDALPSLLGGNAGETPALQSAGKDGLTPEDIQLISMMGVDEEAFKKIRAAERKKQEEL